MFKSCVTLSTKTDECYIFMTFSDVTLTHTLSMANLTTENINVFYDEYVTEYLNAFKFCRLA